MTTEHQTCEVFIVIDANGDYVAHHDADELIEQYDNYIGDECSRTVYRMSVNVPIPAEYQDAGEFTLTEKHQTSEISLTE